MDFRNQVNLFHPACEQELHDRRMMLNYIYQYNDILLRTNEVAHFTASAWIVNPSRTRVLMVYHNIYQSWAWTGGHADGDCSLLNVAVREAKEETGLSEVRPLSKDAFSLEILPVSAHFKKGKYVAPHLHLNLTYLLEADDSLPLRSKPDENSSVAWFDLNDAVAASTEPSMQIIYRKLNDRLVSDYH